MATSLPATYNKLVVTKLTNVFREAIKQETVAVPTPGEDEVLVRTHYVGINASDINFTAGSYLPGASPPFDAGFEAIGEVVATGTGSSLKVGQSVAFMNYGAFAEYIVVPTKTAIPLPSSNPQFLPLLVSGLTAALSVDKVGEVKHGETVLVTAAAGGTGQFAVQWAKMAGCHVIGTCSSDEKAQFLKSIGCDRPVNYNKESLGDVLKKEYPKGVDVTYECVGGEMFNTAVANVALHGRIIVIGAISTYETEGGLSGAINPAVAQLPMNLLRKSASARGFFLPHFADKYAEYLAKLIGGYSKGTIKSVIDNGANSAKGPFKGLGSIADAVDFMYSRKNQGKIVVDMRQ